MKGFLLALCLLVGMASPPAKACGSHSCGPDVNVSVGFVGFGSRPFFNGPYVGGFWGPRVGGFFGPGAGAFRRSFRLQRMANRAAFNGNFVRAARLSARSQNAFANGVSRGGGFFIRPFWM